MYKLARCGHQVERWIFVAFALHSYLHRMLTPESHSVTTSVHSISNRIFFSSLTFRVNRPCKFPVNVSIQKLRGTWCELLDFTALHASTLYSHLRIACTSLQNQLFPVVYGRNKYKISIKLSYCTKKGPISAFCGVFIPIGVIFNHLPWLHTYLLPYHQDSYIIVKVLQPDYISIISKFDSLLSLMVTNSFNFCRISNCECAILCWM